MGPLAGHSLTSFSLFFRTSQIQHQPGVEACIVRFSSLAAAQEALQQLGGGVRGKFR